jgi:pSer/pThr/pTyr-binding forkhead associated (FHA) protein
MADQDSRYEDIERTDVLPQLSLESEPDDRSGHTARLAQPTSLPTHAVKPFGEAAHSDSGNGKISALPAKPSTTDLAVGGIRGKIADLENRLVESQDYQLALKRQCDQLAQRGRMAEERAGKIEASYVQQASEFQLLSQQAAEAQQRLQEQRVRFEAQIADMGRQVIDARSRGDKRAASIEQLLQEQTGRAVNGERALSEARLELEKARGELTVAQSSIKSLEARLTEQTQAAAEVTRLYSQQTGDVEANLARMADTENKLALIQAQKADCDARIAELESEVRAAQQMAATLQSDIALKLRHIAAMEQGLEHRDRVIDTLKAQRATDESLQTDLTAAKASLDRRCAELEQTAAEAKAVAVKSEQEVARLNAALSGNDVRINELAAALRAAESGLKERDAAVAEATGRADSTKSEYTEMAQRAEQLSGRLDEQERQMDGLQAQLQARTAELQAAHESNRASASRQAELAEELRKLEAAFDASRKTMETIMSERNQLESENQSGRAELSRMQSRYEEAVQTVVAARESLAAREQKNATLERELRAATQRLDESNARIERAAAVAESFAAELRQRDSRIALLEQQCAEHASALNAIGQDIERVNSANPNERLAAMGYALEALDSTGAIHRLTRSTTTVGRAATNDISIDSTSVSRYHARIVIQPEGVWLIDLQSTNGCGVNGRRVSRQILCDGDTVMIGHCKFRFAMLNASQEAKASNDEFPLLDEPLLIPDTRGVGVEAAREQRH